MPVTADEEALDQVVPAGHQRLGGICIAVAYMNTSGWTGTRTSEIKEQRYLNGPGMSTTTSDSRMPKKFSVCVAPGVFDTNASLRAITEFSSVDLPTLLRPAKAT